MLLKSFTRSADLTYSEESSICTYVGRKTGVAALGGSRLWSMPA